MILLNLCNSKLDDIADTEKLDLQPSESNDKRNIILACSKGLLGAHFCEIRQTITVQNNDTILVSYEDAIEIASVVEAGDIVRYKREKLGLVGEELPILLRVATEEDMIKYEDNLQEEMKARPIFLDKVEKQGLNMKLVDVHYQFDKRKLFFFYTSDGRVDFRVLAKNLAAEFKTRIELRQIGVRDEAKRLGGLGTCGREFCCASFMNNFKRIGTDLASEQNLSSSLSKLSGPCGKLKCCLSFETS